MTWPCIHPWRLACSVLVAYQGQNRGIQRHSHLRAAEQPVGNDAEVKLLKLHFWESLRGLSGYRMDGWICLVHFNEKYHEVSIGDHAWPFQQQTTPLKAVHLNLSSSISNYPKQRARASLGMMLGIWTIKQKKLAGVEFVHRVLGSHRSCLCMSMFVLGSLSLVKQYCIYIYILVSPPGGHFMVKIPLDCPFPYRKTDLAWISRYQQCSYACRELGKIIGCQRLLMGHGTNKAQKVPKGILEYCLRMAE